MKMKKINWNKICANAGMSFFTSLAANIGIGNFYAFETSIIIAVITAGLAFFTEMKFQCDEGTITAVQKFVQAGLLV